MSLLCNKFTRAIANMWAKTSGLLNLLAPLADLLARLYVARVFFMAGMAKINNWDSTLLLFREEYRVPFLPPELAAFLGTGGELILPILLIIGLFTRFSALGLFILNLVAVISYYETLKDSPVAIRDHIEWGLILGLIMTSHIKNWTIDARLRYRCSAIHRDLMYKL